MEDAKILVKTVARAFHSVENVVVIDALVTHSALSSPDLALAMHLSTSNSNKTVQKLIGELRTGGLVSIFTRMEKREGANKPTPREYYYIDYRRAIDSIKYRVHTLNKAIVAANSSTGQEEKKELKCPRCKAEYTYMDVLDTPTTSGFMCKRCGMGLEEISADSIQQDDTTALWNKQFKPILDLLQKVDEQVVPETTGEQAVADMLPMPRDATNQQAKTEVVETKAAQPTAVKGLAAAPERIEVAITNESETTAAQQAADAERKARIAAQNTLPSWHTTSTITGETFKTGGATGAASQSVAVNGDEKEDRKDEGANLDDVFAMLAVEEEERKRKQAEEEEEEEEETDDEDEFEEVGVTGSSTPLPADGTNGQTSMSGATSVPEVRVDGPPLEATNGTTSAKIDVSTPTGAVDTPKESDEDDDEFEAVAVKPVELSSQSSKRALEATNGESPEAKKAKVEDDAPAKPKADEDSDEDEDEFEDV